MARLGLTSLNEFVFRHTDTLKLVVVAGHGADVSSPYYRKGIKEDQFSLLEQSS